MLKNSEEQLLRSSLRESTQNAVTTFPSVTTTDPLLIEEYAQWLQHNNKLGISPPAYLIYQKEALEVKRVGNREVRPFAPFQELNSALTVVTTSQVSALISLGIGLLIGFYILHLLMLTISMGILTLLYICGFASSSIMATNAFFARAGETIDESIIQALDQRDVKWPTYTILCPLYKETKIAQQFVAAMKALDYPQDRLQVLLLTEEDDDETRAVLSSVYLPENFTIITVPRGEPQTKPRACNFGLLQAKGQFVVIFDAEDQPEPYQLKKAVLTFANHNAELACVQAKLNYYNKNQNILTRLFTAEYSTWFGIMLPGLQRAGFALPLGGTSNHFRTEVLRALGGWDAFNVTEDCDLGLRISQFGLRTTILDSTTYEEATSQLKNWLRQRSRWIKGYLQTYLVHMRHPLQTVQDGHIRSFLSLQVIVGTWTFVLLFNPIMWLLTLFYIAFHPVHLYSILAPAPVLYAGTICLVFGNFFYLYIHFLGCLQRREYALIKWVVFLPLYWVFMSVSAYIALYQLIVKPHYWEKTQHGDHLQAAQPILTSVKVARKRRVLAVSANKKIAIPGDPRTTIQRVRATCDVIALYLKQQTISRKKQYHSKPDPWLIALLLLTVTVSVTATWYSFLHHDILIYDDSYSHIRIARSVLDSATPGIAQLGGVWLPLPHLIMLPFIWNDYLWQTGLAGSIPSMICYTITALYLFLAARQLTNNSCASFVGTLVFVLNPNIIYLQTTPLSEPVCFATSTVACFYFIVWVQTDKTKYLTMTAAATFLATIARYDGWMLFFILFMLIPVIGYVRHHHRQQIEAQLLIFGILGGFGIILWFAWDKVIFGNLLYFKQGLYSSQIQTQYYFHAQLSATTDNLWQSVRYYGFACLDNLGPVVIVLALIAFIKFVIVRRDITMRKNLAEIFAVLPFLTPLLFYVTSFYSGQVIALVPGVSSQLFNPRFGSQAAIPAALFIATLIPGSLKFFKLYKSLAIHAILCGVLIGQSIVIWNSGIVTLEEGQYGNSCIAFQPVDAFLAQHYNGGWILEDTYLGTLNEAQEADIHFKNIIYQGSSSLWKRALQNPGATVDWVIIEIRPKGSPYPVQVNITSSLFRSQFKLVASGGGYDLYLRNNHSPLATKPLPAQLQEEHPYCGTGKHPQPSEW